MSRFKEGFVGIIMYRNIRGNIIRKFIPLAIFIPIAGGLLRLQGQRLNLYDHELGAAFGILFIISFSTLTLWFIARSLNIRDEKRTDVELELNKVKNDLAAKEINYRNLIENSGIVMYSTSLNGWLSFASPKAIELTGYTIEELKSMHFSSLVAAENLEEIKVKHKNQVKNNIQETHSEFYIVTSEAEKKWVEQTTVLIIENDVPVGFQCVIKDISERKKMEEVLHKYEVELLLNQAHLQSILDNATSLIYIKDLEGKYLLTNKQFKEYLNVSDENIIGKTDDDLSGAEQAQRFKDTDAQVIKTGKALEMEDTIERPDGTHNMLIIKFPLLDAQNKIYGISGIATDITERVKYQAQLIHSKKIAEDAKKMQEQFLANMSHEIRTPMNGIQGMTDLLLETPLNSEQDDFVKTIRRSSDSLLVIINDILDFSKIKAGKLTLEKIDFNLKEVLKNIQEVFRHRIKEKGLTLHLLVNNDVPPLIKGDPYRLNQILVNLVGNAIKFTDTGSITISIAVQNKNAEELVLNFIIADTGIGINPEKINEIFESFSQANIETSRVYGGTGLGLAITRQLIEIQKGTISVESKIDYGSSFIFSIPYGVGVHNDALFLAGKKTNNYRSLLKGKKFLVAEDNIVNQKVIVHVLQNAGGAVDIANNGLEAISFLNKYTDYNLVIMDLQMPEMDGYAATKYIRNVMKLSIPIVAMTASALKSEKAKCLEIGMNDYITKPFDHNLLYKRISQLLHNLPVAGFTVPENKTTPGALYNLSLLEEMDDNEYLTDILSIFLTNTPKELIELQLACIAVEFNTVYKITHKLKSSVGLLQAGNLLKLITQMECNAKDEISNGLAKLADLANEEYKKIETLLQEDLKIIRGRCACLDI